MLSRGLVWDFDVSSSKGKEKDGLDEQRPLWG